MLHASLTPYETLIYTAGLRLPRALSQEEIAAKVDETVAYLGLTNCQHSIVGGGLLQSYFPGISGGEKRRLSIATELISDPAALLLGNARFQSLCQ